MYRMQGSIRNLKVKAKVAL